MVISLVKQMVKWLNAFPSKGGILEEMSLKTIVTGVSKPDFSRKITPFAEYAMVYTGTENNMNSRTGFVGIMCSVNEEFTPHVVYEGTTIFFTYGNSTSNLWLS